VLIKNNPQYRSKALKTEDNVDELIQQQEHDIMRVAEVQKYFDKVDKENMEENEYNRTEITEHHLAAAQPKKEVINIHNDQLRIY